MKFFTEDTQHSGPELTDEMLKAAEAALHVQLPQPYIEVLREKNGGVPARRCFMTQTSTSWAEDHIEISALLGVGFDRGIDGEFGSSYLIQEWEYPDIGVVICDTPSGGHDTIMLDYRECGPKGEPRVVYVDDDRSILVLAASFTEFLNGLISCAAMRRLDVSPPESERT